MNLVLICMNPWRGDALSCEGHPIALTLHLFDNGVNCNSQVARPWDKDEALYPSTWIVREAQDFLRRRDTRKRKES
jgi:hypothetical protein